MYNNNLSNVEWIAALDVEFIGQVTQLILSQHKMSAPLQARFTLNDIYYIEWKRARLWPFQLSCASHHCISAVESFPSSCHILWQTLPMQAQWKHVVNVWQILTSLLISMCCCCKVCMVGRAVLVTDTDVLKLCCCELGTDTGVLLTGGCCFFRSVSCLIRKKYILLDTNREHSWAFADSWPIGQSIDKLTL